MDHWILRREGYPFRDIHLDLEGEGSTIRFGRVRSDVICNSVFVSREHCKITRRDDILYIEDCNSINGTYLNNIRIGENVVRELRLDDLIGIGVGGLTAESTKDHFVFQVTLASQFQPRPPQQRQVSEPTSTSTVPRITPPLPPDHEVHEVIDLSDSDTDFSVDLDKVDNDSSHGNPPVPKTPAIPQAFDTPAKILIVPPPPKISYVDEVLPINETANVAVPVPPPRPPVVSVATSPIHTSENTLNNISPPPTSVRSDRSNLNLSLPATNQAKTNEDPIIIDEERPCSSSSKSLQNQNGKNSSHSRKRGRETSRIVSSSSGDDSSDGMSQPSTKVSPKRKKIIHKPKTSDNEPGFVNNARIPRIRPKVDLNLNGNSNSGEQNCADLIKKQWNSKSESQKSPIVSNVGDKESADSDIEVITLDDDEDEEMEIVQNITTVPVPASPTRVQEKVRLVESKQVQVSDPNDEDLRVKENQKSNGMESLDKNEKISAKNKPEPSKMEKPKEKTESVDKYEKKSSKKNKPEPNKVKEPKEKKNEDPNLNKKEANDRGQGSSRISMNEPNKMVKPKENKTENSNLNKKKSKDQNQGSSRIPMNEPNTMEKPKEKKNEDLNLNKKEADRGQGSSRSPMNEPNKEEKQKEKKNEDPNVKKKETKDRHQESSRISMDKPNQTAASSQERDPKQKKKVDRHSDGVKVSTKEIEMLKQSSQPITLDNTPEVQVLIPILSSESESGVKLHLSSHDRASLSPACLRRLKKQLAKDQRRNTGSSNDSNSRHRKSRKDDREKKKHRNKDTARNDPKESTARKNNNLRQNQSRKEKDDQPTTLTKAKSQDTDRRSKEPQPKPYRVQNGEPESNIVHAKAKAHIPPPADRIIDEERRLEEIKNRIRANPVPNKGPKLLDVSPAPRKMRGHQPPRPLERNMSREFVRQHIAPPQPQPVSPEKSDSRARAKPIDKKLRLKELTERANAAKALAESSKPPKQVVNAPIKVKSSQKSRQDTFLEDFASTATAPIVPPSPERRASLVVADPILESRPSVDRDQSLRTRHESSSIVENKLKTPSNRTSRESSSSASASATARLVNSPSVGSPNISGKLASTASQVYRDVLNWNTNWLDDPPKQAEQITCHREIITNLPAFQDYKSYLNTFYPLMLLELWEKVLIEYRTFNQQGESNRKKYELQIGVESEKTEKQCPIMLGRYRIGGGASEQGWYLLKVVARVSSENDLDLHNDFGIITLPVKGRLGETRRASFFGFFLKHSEKLDPILPETKIPQCLFEQAKTKKMKYSIDVLTHLGSSTLVMDQLGTIQRFAYLNPMLQTFRSISILPTLPLFKNVLHPEATCPLAAPPEDFVFTPDPAFGVCNLLQGSQKEALLHIGFNVFGDKRNKPELLLVNGGPGTGKTLTIVGLILYLLRFNQDSDPRRSKSRLLICAPSSAALDSVILQIRSSLGDFLLVRIGEGSNDTKEFSLEALARDETGQKINLDLDDERRRCSILKKADIVCATLTSCYDPMMQKTFGVVSAKDNAGSSEGFTCCIMDDATLVTEPESLAPLTLNCFKLVLFGDPMQHCPRVISKEAAKKDYHQSLYLRLFNLHQNSSPRSPVLHLDVQFRLHPDIFRWPNLSFYKGTIKSHDSLLSQRNRLRIVPYLFLDVLVTKKSQPENISIESLVVGELLRIIRWQGTIERSHIHLKIGVITPNLDHKIALLKAVDDLKVSDRKSVEVKTIKEFRGREKDIIILFCVKTKNSRLFMPNEDLNVSLTRAKQCLYIVGNSFRLNEEEIWKSLTEDAKRRSLFKSVPEATITSSDGGRAFLEKCLVVQQGK